MKQIYMICPNDEGATLTFADGSVSNISQATIDKLYIEAGGYYGGGQYVPRARYEAERG